MRKDRKNVQRKHLSEKQKVTLRIVVLTLVVLIAISIAVFCIKFFPSPFAQEIAPENISIGTASMTGQSDILVAYFSIAGNRVYTSETVDAVSSASLTIKDGQGYGHAELYAITASDVTGGDLFPIRVIDQYPESYHDAFSRHQEELSVHPHLELMTRVENMSDYHTVILIYPTWLGGMPYAVLSFLEEYDFSGKTIVPIATSQALGLGSTPEIIAEYCPTAVVTAGLSVRSEDALRDFLEKLNL